MLNLLSLVLLIIALLSIFVFADGTIYPLCIGILCGTVSLLISMFSNPIVLAVVLLAIGAYYMVLKVKEHEENNQN